MDDAHKELVLDAMRVSRFMEAGKSGRWRLTPFTITPVKAELERIQASMNSPDPELSIRRLAGPGDYIKLERRALDQELADYFYEDGGVNAHVPPEGRYVPVMSDTPAELAEHDHAIENATGRVLVLGLGLGCIVQGLLKKPCAKCDGIGSWPRHTRQLCPDCGGRGTAVTHIDVVEVDADVIALTGPYYEGDDRVTIHQGDAISWPIPPDASWDYVWHDIWTAISDSNLHADRAEHGISYDMLFDRYAPYADQQGAWAYEAALEFHDRMKARHDHEIEWLQALKGADREGRIELLTERVVREKVKLPYGWEMTPELVEFFAREMKVREFATRIVDDGTVMDDATIERFLAMKYDTGIEALPRPNEVEA